MPRYDMTVDEDGCNPDDCTYCGHPWISHQGLTLARQCAHCICKSYEWREQPAGHDMQVVAREKPWWLA